MSDAFLKLSASDRHEVLAVAADRAGRPGYLLEKDIWVVWTLSAMFSAPFGDHLVFKGGTSLSKAYGAIRRFSEDVDLTYDIRQIASDLTENGTRLVPPSRSQQRRWTDAIRERLAGWLASTALPAIERAIAEENLPARAKRGE
jgi:predicted nucleotidyltransferase component of viral defense system